MFCTNCGEKAESHYSFCGNCGFSLSGENQDNNRRKSHKPYTFIRNENDIQIMIDYRKYRDWRDNMINRYDIVLLLISTLIIYGAALFFAPSDSDYVVPLIIATMFLIISGIFISLLGLASFFTDKFHRATYPYVGLGYQDVYKTLESAKERKSGNSASYSCIYCGNHRHYKKGVYASNKVEVHCTNCKEFLYYD